MRSIRIIFPPPHLVLPRFKDNITRYQSLILICSDFRTFLSVAYSLVFIFPLYYGALLISLTMHFVFICLFVCSNNIFLLFLTFQAFNVASAFSANLFYFLTFFQFHSYLYGNQECGRSFALFLAIISVSAEIFQRYGEEKKTFLSLSSIIINI